ncbi:unnamed protein product [Caenorhabditis angaria]|uniref:Glutaredoxin domain-containing protein n=1 Tax=Caenorhabditis angaria TaxID=860376 RepID=A0A9P1N0P9_9PELO|nr:unnamed protein product [Caenorhabditis angaria]
MPQIWGILENYGWIIVFSSLSLYLIYQKWIAGLVESRRSAKLLEERKKFDDEVGRKEKDNVRAARLRQQEKHDKLEEEERIRRELKRKEELERILSEKSVLETVVGSFERKKPEENKEEPQSAEEILEALISSKPIIIFTKSFCPFSRKIRQLIATYRLAPELYDFIDLDDEEGNLPAEDIQNLFATRFGALKSVPKMWVNGEFVGGYEEILEYSKAHATFL